MASSIASRSVPRSPRRLTSSPVNWVRTAIMPHPMSTPTAAGMTAPRVGMTEPTVAPLPRCASGMSARCGNTNGIDAVRCACASVLSSRTDAQFISRLLICSMVTSGWPPHRSREYRGVPCLFPPVTSMWAGPPAPLRRLIEPALPGSRGAGRSEVAAAGLLALDRLEQRFEVSLSEPLRAMALNQLEEHRRAVLHRLGEDLQQVTVLIPVGEGVVVAVRRVEERHPGSPHGTYGGHDVVGDQGDVLHACPAVELQVLVDL